VDIRVNIYCRLNLLGASVFDFKRLDILRDSIGHPSKKLLLFGFGSSFIFNFEHLDILRDSIGHPSKKLLTFQIAGSIFSQFRASRYITGLNRTS